MFDVSILLLTRNGVATLPRLIDALRQQDYDAQVEIVAVDSGSVDGTIALLEPQVDRLLTVDPHGFNHGETRNLGLRAATKPLVVLVVQDAVPASATWLQELVRPLHDDVRVAAAWSRQVPRPEASGVTRMHLQRWVGASPVPRVAAVDGPSAFQRMQPWDQFELCAFDNVCSCIRRSVWERHPFPRVPIGEDIEWARDVLLAGYRIVYAPGSVVQHSHERSARYEFMRTLLIHHRLRTLFGLSTVPGVVSLAHAIVSSGRAHAACLRNGPRADRRGREWSRAMALSVAWPLGQYLGARLAECGVRLEGIRGI